MKVVERLATVLPRLGELLSLEDGLAEEQETLQE
jgi:hypothetical protein